MSFIALGLAYKTGLMKPMVVLPAARRFWLISVKMAPRTGAEADVPKTSEEVPFTTMMKFAPLAEISGNCYLISGPITYYAFREDLHHAWPASC